MSLDMDKGTGQPGWIQRKQQDKPQNQMNQVVDK